MDLNPQIDSDSFWLKRMNINWLAMIHIKNWLETPNLIWIDLNPQIDCNGFESTKIDLNPHKFMWIRMDKNVLKFVTKWQKNYSVNQIYWYWHYLNQQVHKAAYFTYCLDGLNFNFQQCYGFKLKKV